jgi:hypothetical protein
MHTARDNLFIFFVSLPTTNQLYDCLNEVSCGFEFSDCPLWPWGPDVKNAVINGTSNNNK